METQTQEKGPAASPRLDPKLVTLWREIQQKAGDVAGLPKAPAALMVGHMLADLGAKRALAMTGAEARAYVAAFFRRVPMATSAVMMAHTPKFVKVCKMYRIECDTPEGYQVTISRLVPPQSPDALASSG